MILLGRLTALLAAVLVVLSTAISGAFATERVASELRQAAFASMGIKASDICGTGQDHGDCPLCRLTDRTGQALMPFHQGAVLVPVDPSVLRDRRLVPATFRPLPPLRAPPLAVPVA